MGLKGNLNNMKGLKARLRSLPRTVAAAVAAEAAPVITDRIRTPYHSGRTAYEDPRPLSVEGKPLDLNRTGETAARLRFVAIGTTLRAKLGTPYAKYLIGRFDILPNGALPKKWKEDLAMQLDKVAPEVFKGRR